MNNGGGVKPNGGGTLPPPRELLSAEEAARFLALYIKGGGDKPSASAVYHLRHRGAFSGYNVVVKIGRRTLYSISGLRKYIAAHTV